MKYFLRFTTIILLLHVVISVNSVTIHTIGDSTMSDYDENTTDKRGWGMMFQQFFTPDVIINNRAKSGASSKSFYQESPYWATVKTQINSGDYVFIQFAHNDEKNGGLDGDTVRKYTDPNADYRGTTAQVTYKTYLKAYINETRALGATPVLVTPICRKYFSGGTITRKGHHDLGGDYNLPETDHTHDYVYAMKQVATEMSVELIDLTSLTKNMFEAYGDAACTSLLFCTDDSTHPNAMGGTLVARLCAQAMVNQNIMAQYVNASSDLLINPSVCDFESAYTGQTLTKELTISGFDLNPDSGSFSLSVTDGFLIATSKSNVFTPSVTINYSNSNLDFSKFYIKTSHSQAGQINGTLTCTNGTITKTIPLTASFIELIGGTEVSVMWELSANTNYVLTGPAIPVDEYLNEMYVQRYSVPNSTTLTESTSWDVTQKMQRNLIIGDAWPANEIDEVSTRFMQFGITANANTELNIDSIGLYIAGAGGNGMRCRISYSTDNFSTSKVIHEFASMVANTVYEVSAIPIEKLSYSDTLKVRIYPWYSSAATGKTICLGNMCIHGIATNITSINTSLTTDLIYDIKEGSIVIKNVPEKCHIHILDLSGKNIYNKLHLSSGTITVKKPKQSGIYICRVISEKMYNNQKIIIK
ncbi:MAG: hypothetical protein JW717_13475 [Marinilabiliaceae bacterium]|nr:hypothetical protein [Marinilabiliaceae bacterium]